MSDTIIAAIIGGCFTVVAVLIGNYLKPKSGVRTYQKQTVLREKKCDSGQAVVGLIIEI